MSEVVDYLNLIPSANRSQPNFVAFLTAILQPLVQIQNVYDSMIPKFDVEVAVGDQLDIIGKWVGVSRNIKVPIDGVYFTWDGTDYTLGWDYGSWQPSEQPTNITSLPDDAYRTLIKARIAANSWDGTTEGAYVIWDSLFPQLKILIQDNEDMTFAMIFYGAIVDSLTLALITSGYIPLKPEGVRITEYYIPVNPGPVFGWDIENDIVQGWNEGSWTREINPT